jgi:hypothetical protein
MAFPSLISRSPLHPMPTLPCSLVWTLRDSLGGGFRKIPFALLALPTIAWGNSRSVHAPKPVIDRWAS